MRVLILKIINNKTKMMTPIKKILALLVVVFISLFISCSNDDGGKEPDGKNDNKIILKNGVVDQFTYTGYEPLSDKPVAIFYYIPQNLPKDAPIMFLMHGNGRNANGYINSMKFYADKHKFMVIAPRFSTDYYPSRDYHRGGVFDEGGKMREKTDWTFSMIEPLFDHVKKITNKDNQGYILYGFSAGSQFVHRYTWFYPDNRAIQTIPVAAGSYTMPDYEIDYYHGLKDVKNVVPEGNLKKAFAKELTVAVGTADTIRSDSDLPKSAKDDAQGKTRVERAEFYYNSAKALAQEMGVEFNWKFVLVPGVGHSSGQMAPHVVESMINFD